MHLFLTTIMAFMLLLYGCVHATTPYDDAADDIEQLRFLRKYLSD